MTQWILTSSVLILLVIAVRGLFKEKMKAKYTYALWLLVLVRLLCPVNFGELSFNLLSLAEEGKAQVEERLEEREEERASWQVMQEFGETVYLDNGKVVTVLPYYPGEVSYEVSEQVSAAEAVEDNTTEAVPVAKNSGFQFPEIHWQKVLPVVWAVGMVVIALVIVSVNISFSTMLGLFRKELPTFTRKGRGSQKLSVYLADGIYSSCLYGVVRPSIYLNRKGMGEQEKKYCIEHEYSHYLQGDMVWSVCRIVCLILHWYNPLVWLAVTLSKKDAELACDERTIERLGEEERYSYGHTLVELAANQSKAVQMFGMATLMASDKKEVVNRVKAITTKKQTKIITGVLVMCLLVGIGCFVFTGVAKGEQENNKNAEQVVTEVTETPVPTATVAPTEGPTATPTEEPMLTPTEGPTPAPAMGMMSNTPGEEYVYARVPGKNLYQREEGINIKDEVEYQDISFTDTLQVTPEKGKGWKIDLDGDGTKELFYLDELRGIYINEVLIQWMDFRDGCELSFLDIDTTDGIYEIAIDGNAYYYDGTSLQKITSFIKQKWSSGEFFVSDIVNFERVDEHTISFLNYNRICHAIIRSNFVLDENHQLKLAEGSNSYNAEHVHEKVDMRGDRTEHGSSAIEYVAELENQFYTEITFIDHMKLETTDGEGWLVDLNGDGTKEQISIYDNSVCVNGYSMIRYLDGMNSCIWLLDIDTTDGMYEILLENGSLWIYDGSKLTWVWSLWNYSWKDGCVYQGKLSEFTRIDEHTISFENIDQGNASYEKINGYNVVTYRGTDDIAEYQYRLNENHELVLLENEEQ